MTTVILSKNCLNSLPSGAESTVFCADIGTSSLKAALVSKDGTVAAFSQQPFQLDTAVDCDISSAGKNASARIDSSGIARQWLPALERAAQEFGIKMQTVQALCISGNGPTIVSENGTTLLWNDTVPDSIAAIPSHSLFTPRIAAFKAIFPAEWNKSKYIFSGPEYILYQLTGKAVTFLPEKRYETAYWNKESLDLFAIADTEREKLPPFCLPAQNLGNTTDKMTHFLHLNCPVPVFSGVPDFIAALIGTNTLIPGKICNRAGSSEGLNLCTGKPVAGEKIRTLPSVISGLWNASVLLTSSGKRFSDYKTELEKEYGETLSYRQVTEQSLADKTSQGYKIMQNLAFCVRDGLNILEKAANENHIPCSKEITITGGQAKSPAWVQMKADISGRTFTETALPDAELLGDAVLAYAGLGIYKSIQEAADSLVKIGRKFTPAENFANIKS